MKSKKVRWLVPLMTLALIFTLGVAACSNDDEKENNGNNAIEGAATEVSGEAEQAATEVTGGVEGAATEVAGGVEGAATEVSGAVQGAATEVAGGDEAAGDQLIADSKGLTGDATNGEALFTSLGCSGCHDVSTGTSGTGPSLKGVSAEAGEDSEGMSAEDFLRESIVHPDAQIAEGFQPGIMPSFADKIDAQQLADLVAYLMTL